jgi:hypothetical protein
MITSFFDMSLTLLLLFRASMQIKIILTDCQAQPASHQIIGWSCTASSPISLSGNDNIIIQDSTFSGGNSEILQLAPISSSIKISGVNFLNVNGWTFAIRIGGATEFTIRNTIFQNIINAGAIGSINGNNDIKNMFTMYNITFDNVKSANSISIIKSEFDYVYGEKLIYISCLGCAAFEAPWSSQQVPVFYDMNMDSCSFSRANFLGIPNSYFVLVNGKLTNTKDFFESRVRMYYENISFISTDNIVESAIVPNGPFSIIGCTFKRFTLAVAAKSSNEECFICRSTFENCGTCFQAHQERADIVNCIFTEYTIAAIDSDNGHQNLWFSVIGCLFISNTAPAIINHNTIVISLCCFDRDGIVIEQKDQGKLKIGVGCCIKQPLSDSVSGGTIISTEEIDCTKKCSSTIDQSEKVCNGYYFSPRPTPLPTQSPIVIWNPTSNMKPKTQTPKRTKSPIPPETKTPTPAKTKTATPIKTKIATPAKTKTATPVKTKTATPVKTKTATPAKTKTATPDKTKSATPGKTNTATPVKT